MRCMKCGKELPEDLLDSKPKSLANTQATHFMLEKAADRGEDFTVVQCATCYGPAFTKGTSK